MFSECQSEDCCSAINFIFDEWKNRSESEKYEFCWKEKMVEKLNDATGECPTIDSWTDQIECGTV